MAKIRKNALSRLPENWTQLSPEQKRKYRLDKYLNGEGIDFVSPEAKEAYKVRAQRMVDVFNVQEPDMVPVNLPGGGLALERRGLNNEKNAEEREVRVGGGTSGRAMEILDYKIYAWPGHGLPQDASGMQYIEGEYMIADEYDDLILDPTDFWLRTYLPRVFGAFEGFKMFQPFTNITENVHIGQLAVLGSPEVQGMLQQLMDAGKEFKKSRETAERAGVRGRANQGFPVMGSHFAKAPFDTLGDTLRGTEGIMKDMFRCPDKLLEALDVIADISINTVLKSPNFHRIGMVGYPLHKGADGWMSQKQFETFYWPSMKKMMNAFIEEGLIQRLFAEGCYNTRLESINEFPKGTVTWHFEQTDMAKAKEILGDTCCIQGNVPISLLMTGEPAEVKACCRKLIEICGKDGGYILSAGSGGRGVKLENIQAMQEAVEQYGVYGSNKIL